jgi:hypothetical protein
MHVIMFKTITNTSLHKTTKKHKFNKTCTFIETTEFSIHTLCLFYSNKHIAVSAVELTADRICGTGIILRQNRYPLVTGY